MILQQLPAVGMSAISDRLVAKLLASIHCRVTTKKLKIVLTASPQALGTRESAKRAVSCVPMIDICSGT